MPTRDQVLRSAEFSEREDTEAASEFTFHNPRKSPKHELMFGHERASALAGGVHGRIVVTDDKGRYLIPDLPKVNYSVWVRGYGLVDSPKLRAAPGKLLNHTAVPAPNEAAAAQYYSAIYWYSMLTIPDAKEFGGKGAIPQSITQAEWLTGQAGPLMINPLAGHLGGAPFKYFADWTDRIAKGELPHSKPEGIERNIVVTWWEWGEPKKYLDRRRKPLLRAAGDRGDPGAGGCR